MKNYICILGSFNVDMVAKLDHFPKGGETILAKQHFMGAGGKGTNQAIAAANANGSVHFITKVGKDYFKEYARDILNQSKINTYTLYESQAEGTGTALIYVSEENGENTIAVCSGANVTFTHEEIQSLSDHLSQAGIFLTQLENNFDAIQAALVLAKSHHCLTVLNPAPYSNAVLPMLPYIDIITPNETEASFLSGISVVDIESAKEAARAIAAKGVGTVLITLGAKGSLLYTENHFSVIEAFKVDAVDTTGAGDAFNGALVAALSRGDTLIEACRYASIFASLAVERVGASNMPSHEACLSRIAVLQQNA